MHALVASVLLGLAWVDTLDGDAEFQPPGRQTGKTRRSSDQAMALENRCNRARPGPTHLWPLSPQEPEKFPSAPIRELLAAGKNPRYEDGGRSAGAVMRPTRELLERSLAAA